MNPSPVDSVPSPLVDGLHEQATAGAGAPPSLHLLADVLHFGDKLRKPLVGSAAPTYMPRSSRYGCFHSFLPVGP
jgi:hypothetical protein